VPVAILVRRVTALVTARFGGCFGLRRGGPPAGSLSRWSSRPAAISAGPGP